MTGETEDVDYQLGAHKLDTSGSIVEDDDVIEFDFESGAVFRRLADDIYESPEAGIREPLTNAITTVRRVFGNESDEGVIKITVQDGDQVMLRLRDNGEGISKGVLNEVLTVIGRSNARDDGELSGQYGMGFLASYKLVGMDGGFLMCTNPRDTDDGPYSGLFKPGTFEPDKNGQLPKLLDEDEYGTVFEYYIRDDISISDIREWVQTHARWSPVPVIYQELDEDGSEDYNEDFHAGSLDDVYGESPSLHVENEYYEAATSPESKNDIILISSPVKMSGTRSLRRKLPWQVDLRLKYENGAIFKGPNKGLVPVREEEYNEMEDGRKSSYIPKSEMEDEDMCLPEPTGTRERMRRHKDFLRYVNDQLKEKYFDQVESTLDNFDPSQMSLTDLDDMGQHIMLRIFSKFDDNDTEYTTSDVKRKISNQYNYDTDDENLLEFIQTMTSTLPVVSEDKGYSKKYPRKPAYSLDTDDEVVFMCVSKNSWKAEAVEQSETDAHIVKVESSSEYTPFEKHLNWSKLKEIKKSNVTEMLDIDEEDVEAIRDSSGSKAEEIEDRSVTIHHASGGRNTLKKSASYLVEYYDDSTGGSRMGDVLVVFPRLGDENVSDNYNLADNRCCVASCGKKMTEYLTENSKNIVTYDDYADWISSRTVISSKGFKTANNLFRMADDLLVYVDSNVDSVLENTDILKYISDQIESEKDEFTNLELAMVDKETWVHLNNQNKIPVNSAEVVRTPNRTPQDFGLKTHRFDFVELFMKNYVPEEIHETEEFRSLMNSHNEMCTDVLVNAEILVKTHETEGAEFVSRSQTNSDGVVLPEHKTKDGEMTIEEIYSEYNPENVIIHSLSTDKFGMFKDSKILNHAGDKLSGLSIHKYNIPKVIGSSIYVPMLETEYEKVKDYVHEDTIILGEWEIHDDRVVDIEPEFVYATVHLKGWSSEEICKVVRGHGFKRATNLVDTLSEVPKSELPSYNEESSDVIARVTNKN